MHKICAPIYRHMAADWSFCSPETLNCMRHPSGGEGGEGGMKEVLYMYMHTINSGATTINVGKFGTGSIFLTNVECTRAEGRLADCSASNDTDTCSHLMDVMVKCSTESKYE